MRNARTDAITRNQSVVIHGINGDWSQGWRIILDISGKGAEDSSNPLLVERASGTRVPIVGNWSVRTIHTLQQSGRTADARKGLSGGDIAHLRGPRAGQPAPGGAGLDRSRQPAQPKG